MRNKFKKKNTIILSALKLFSKKGFYNTTISEISKNMGVSVGNIYNYFPSKNSLAKASITFVAKKLATNLRYINNQNISSREKVYMFVISYLNFLKEHPEMIDYFFRVYLSNREVFCKEEDCGFQLAKDFIDEIEILIDTGTENGEFKKQNFYVGFSCITGILGGITFLNGEKVLEDDLNIYAWDLSTAICKALS